MTSVDRQISGEPDTIEPDHADFDCFDFAYLLQTPVWVFDIDERRVHFANAPACQLWRAESEDDLRARNFASDMSSTVHNRLKQYQADFATGATFKEMWTLYPNGEPNSVEVLFSGFRLSDGRVALLCEATHLQEEVPENLRSMEALLHTDVMITLFRRDGRPLYMNPAARNAAHAKDSGLSAQFVDTREFDILLFELDRKGEHTMMARIHTVHGVRWHNLTAKLCLDAATGDAAILVSANDVTELKEARDRSHYLANRDQLTGCFNRFYLQQVVEDIASHQPQNCALLFFDIDRFKQINDRFGHEMGDVVLKKLTERAHSSIKKTDVLARLGGDEFVILFENTPEESKFEAVAHRLLETFRDPIVHGSAKIAPTVSMGLTFFTPDASNFTSILKQADIALYASKIAGRDRLTVFNEDLGKAAEARNQIELDLKFAIEREEFVLHFQPRIDFRTGRTVSMEALVRWQHPTRGLVMPGDFIPFCEETGLIERVGQLILEMGLQQALAWRQNRLDMGISINISPTQFDDPKLMDALRLYARLPDFPSHKVELELTENVLVGNQERLAKKLRDIADLGYRIAIDDFGVGYSNLSYISNFPVHCIKIDRSFISQLPEAGPVVQLILTLAHQIGACTVAEGVETEEQAAWLRRENCDQAQGFLFARPQPLSDLSEALFAGWTETA